MRQRQGRTKKLPLLPEKRPAHGAAPELVAAIDLGASAVRMMLAQVHPDGNWTALENLTQSVNLGREVFQHGYISQETTEEIVGIFRQFRRRLSEYRLDDPACMRAVATSAVREAENREAFLDRIFIATGIQVEVASAADINRMTFMALTRVLETENRLRRGALLITEVGGGVTEFLGLEKGRVKFSRTSKLGLLRLRDQIAEHRIAPDRLKPFLNGQIDSSLGSLRKTAGFGSPPALLLMGGEARFAAATICPEHDEGKLCRLPTRKVAKLADELLALPAEEVAARYGLSHTMSETVGPALLCHVRLAALFGAEALLVTNACLRDGIIAEMVGGAAWNRELRRQVLASADEIGGRYQCDRTHAKAVARHARQLFSVLQTEHALPAHSRLILEVAALLHDAGMLVSPRSHHKHSMYLIQNSELFGLGEQHRTIAALTARYHRKSPPRPAHEEFVRLDRKNRVVVMKLAAILRIADALDCSHSRRNRPLTFELEDDRLVIRATGPAAAWAQEEVAVQAKGDMLRDVFGIKPAMRFG